MQPVPMIAWTLASLPASEFRLDPATAGKAGKLLAEVVATHEHKIGKERSCVLRWLDVVAASSWAGTNTCFACKTLGLPHLIQPPAAAQGFRDVT